MDEFNPCGAQVVLCDANMMKVLLSPVSPGTVRARQDDITLPAGLLRVFTSNTTSLESWLEPLRAEPGDLAAITRRIATLHISHSLWRAHGTGRPSGSIPRIPAKRSFASALSYVQSGLG